MASVKVNVFYDIASGLLKTMNETVDIAINSLKTRISGNSRKNFVYEFKKSKQLESSSSSLKGIESRLLKLKQLQQDGLITKEEANRKRQELLKDL